MKLRTENLIRMSVWQSMKSCFATIAILVAVSYTVGVMNSGCTSKPAPQAAAPTTAQPPSTGTADTTGVKPTAEQEAAKQRGMAQGAAIQAALKKSQGNQ